MLKLTSLPFRIAVVNALDTKVIYNGFNIRVFENYLQETTTKKKAILPGNIEAYIIILNQTSNQTLSNKCNRNNNDSIQIQINTVYPAGKGGSELSEKIANIVLSLLFPTSIKQMDLVIGNGLDLWKSDLVMSKQIDYDGNSSRTWITQLMVEAYISQ